MKVNVLFIALLMATIGYSQNGINYKALIKGGNGNIITNTNILIQFTIFEDATNTYQETHAPTTDVNGIVIVNIGEGSSISGDFNLIDWATENHTLNVQIDTGNGFIDIGTTQFMSVPYAKHALTAANVTGLEAINEGNGVGWRLIGKTSENYGNIGFNAIDISSSENASVVFGATGGTSIAMGFQTEASGGVSTAMGNRTIASGFDSTAMGNQTTASGTLSTAIGQNATASGIGAITMGSNTLASGDRSIAFGLGTEASGYTSTTLGSNTTASGRYTIAMGFNTSAIGAYQVVLGRYNFPFGDSNSWVSTDPLFIIGNGSGNLNRHNAFTVLKNGNVGIGVFSPDEVLHIDGRLKIGTETIEDTGTNQLSFNASLLPDVDNEMNLGNSTHRWNAVWAVDGTINTSDKRDKTNIKPLNYGLNEVLQLNPVSFNWKTKSNKDKKLGLIAQELQDILPEVVKLSESKENDRLGVYYSDLIPVLIKAIQEQQRIIDNQKLKMQGLISEVTELKMMNVRVKALEQQLNTAEQ